MSHSHSRIFLHPPYNRWIIPCSELVLQLQKSPPANGSIKDYVMGYAEPFWGWDEATKTYLDDTLLMAEREVVKA